MANILTISRMVFSLILLLPPAFSTSFAVIYFLAGLTDMLDGWVARRTGTVSETGARLDTVADIVFVIVCLIKILPVVVLPTYVLQTVLAETAVVIGHLGTYLKNFQKPQRRTLKTFQNF